ncbi:hypothetical protein C8J57DRAFT_1281202 [Mycena rebaudengoi]|nr:hypothetical protein C8J57DRAFT_1281202 [Mycena rebaudengoi]
MTDSTLAPDAMLDGTLGSIEIGGVVSTFLFGIVTLQVWNYYRRYPADGRTLKLLVAVIWFLELGHGIATCHAIYTLTITFYGQPQRDPPRSLQTTLLFSAPIYTLVQIFFANRIRLLSGRLSIMLICCCLTLLRFAGSMGMLVVTMIEGLAVLQVDYRWLMCSSLALGAAVDIIIAISLCCCLWQLRHSELARLRKLGDTAMAWSIETGAATSGASIIQLILFLMRDDLVWFPFFLVTARLFSNSLLVSLNGRARLRSMTQENVSYINMGSFEQSLRETKHRTGVLSAPAMMEAYRLDSSRIKFDTH